MLSGQAYQLKLTSEGVKPEDKPIEGDPRDILHKRNLALRAAEKKAAEKTKSGAAGSCIPNFSEFEHLRLDLTEMLNEGESDPEASESEETKFPTESKHLDQAEKGSLLQIITRQSGCDLPQEFFDRLHPSRLKDELAPFLKLDYVLEDKEENLGITSLCGKEIEQQDRVHHSRIKGLADLSSAARNMVLQSVAQALQLEFGNHTETGSTYCNATITHDEIRATHLGNSDIFIIEVDDEKNTVETHQLSNRHQAKEPTELQGLQPYLKAGNGSISQHGRLKKPKTDFAATISRGLGHTALESAGFSHTPATAVHTIKPGIKTYIFLASHALTEHLERGAIQDIAPQQTPTSFIADTFRELQKKSNGQNRTPAELSQEFALAAKNNKDVHHNISVIIADVSRPKENKEEQKSFALTFEQQSSLSLTLLDGSGSDEIAHKASQAHDQVTENTIKIWHKIVEQLGLPTEEIDRRLEILIKAGIPVYRQIDFLKFYDQIINNLNLPFDSAEIHFCDELNPSKPLQTYQTSLRLRGLSFCEGAEKYLAHQKPPKSPAAVTKLKAHFLEVIDSKNPLSESTAQAHYDILLRELQKIIPKKDLADAEALVNIKKHKPVITITESANGYTFQIDRPANRFSHLTYAQRLEYLLAYFSFNPDKIKNLQVNKLIPQQLFDAIIRSKDKIHNLTPKWFRVLPAWQQRELCQNLSQVLEGEDIAIAEPATLNQRPGLRNAWITQTITITSKKEGGFEVSAGNNSIRSSAVKVESDENYETNKIQTVFNLEQILFLHQHYPLSSIWNFQQSEKVVFCQSLLKPFGGGDMDVENRKNRAIQTINKKNEKTKTSPKYVYVGSNHNITGNPFAKLFLRLFNSETNATRALIKTVLDFFNSCVNKELPTPSNDPSGLLAPIGQCFKQALKGKLNPQQALAALNAGIKDPTKAKSALLVLNAISAYIKETNRFFARPRLNNGLYVAALEGILITETGNIFHSACKSGKDREAILQLMMAAMREYFATYSRLPTLDDSKEDRANFIDIFIRLFLTNHHAYLSETNSAGCQGLKSLQNVLPSDIYAEIKRRELEGILILHKHNAALNKMDNSKVTPSKEENQAAKKAYKVFVDDNTNRNLGLLGNGTEERNATGKTNALVGVSYSPFAGMPIRRSYQPAVAESKKGSAADHDLTNADRDRSLTLV